MGTILLNKLMKLSTTYLHNTEVQDKLNVE